MSSRTRTAERLSAAGNLPTDKNRSGELDNLKAKYETFVAQFQPFIACLKNYHTALVNLEHNRSEVLQQIEMFTSGTPLFDHAGKGNTLVVAAPTWAKTFATKNTSFCSIERQMSALNDAYAKQVTEFCIEYANEWEIVVKTRISASIDKSIELRQTWQHYDVKVNKLQEAEAKMTAKGKALGQNAKDKLTRNQTKLQAAKEEFDKYATSTAHVIDAALECAWHDVTPLVFRLANMEYDRLGGENSTALTQSLVDLTTKLREFATQHEIELALPDQLAKKAPSSATKNKGTSVPTPAVKPKSNSSLTNNNNKKTPDKKPSTAATEKALPKKTNSADKPKKTTPAKTASNNSTKKTAPAKTTSAEKKE